MAFSVVNNKKGSGNGGPGKWKKEQAGIDLPQKEAPVQRLDAAQAWQKIKPFCGYQERCHSDVKEKLYSYGLHRQDVEQLVSRLIEENYLNEERFAIAYASGHYRIKKWGKVKITHGLKQKGVGAYCIKKALQEIDQDEYLAGLQKLTEQKWELLRKERMVARRFKCRQFLLQRGFESSLINEAVKEVEGT